MTFRLCNVDFEPLIYIKGQELSKLCLKQVKNIISQFFFQTPGLSGNKTMMGQGAGQSLDTPWNTYAIA